LVSSHGELDFEPTRRIRTGFSQRTRIKAHGSGDARMTPAERCDLVLAFARTLFVNGQATNQTLAAAERLARAGPARKPHGALG
jgi:hypothetical protein